MCVSQFQAYCKASSFKRPESLTANDKVDCERGTFDGKRYVSDKRKMRKLAEANNPYAIATLKRWEAESDKPL